MDKKEYLVFFKDFCNQMVELTVKKNADYTGITQDPFHNFRSCEALNIASSLQGLQVRMLDKMARINSFAQKGILEVKTETVLDTCMDLAVYAILTAAFIKSEADKDFLEKLPEWGSSKIKEEELNLEIKFPPEVSV